MVRAVFRKVRGGMLAPADPEAEALISSLAIGDGIAVEAKRTNNIKFHRKLFALLRLAFDVWDPQALSAGANAQKSFERFRKDILILAGHYEPVFRLDGSVELVAKSLSFAKCDEIDRAQIYADVLNVVWEKIMKEAGYLSAGDIDRVVNELLAFG